MKYRVSYDTILDPLSRVYTSNANLYRIYAEHFAHLGRVFPVTNADLRGRDRADAECKHSYNTRTYAPISTQEYKRHYARICVDSFTQFGLRTTAYGV